MAVICPKDSKTICSKQKCPDCELSDYINRVGYFRICNVCKNTGKQKVLGMNFEIICRSCGGTGKVHYVNRNDFTSIKLR